ncbi:hypothetical protein QA584_17530 [Anaerocolumna sp. AGMB13025]|uniref:hypothetical protein n=1 Tax=Anaerocolumna sp. AGMB13025 TaxID=3039116 RepID=UPI00241CDEBE|nr:hypothetical protein [Anaerocolumna sp. AGMB13025]WFR55403.1 hypothetical protein QA584_17530 [Anaerocolumna sp. AGMB13025]
MRNKWLLLFMVMVMVCSPVKVSKAALSEGASNESKSELQERVFSEVLSGNISNDADVLGVALTQYEERNYGARISGYGINQERNDDSLSITQMIETRVDTDNHILKDLVSTNLAVVDKNQNFVTASDIVISVENGSAQLSDYSIYATMSVSVTNDITGYKVRFNWFDTKLIYGTALKAASLVQASTYQTDAVFGYDDVTIATYNPKANIAYHYSPQNLDMIPYSVMGAGRACRSEIKAGTSTVIFGYTLNYRDQMGIWETEFN